MNFGKYIGGSLNVQPGKKDSRLLREAKGPYERLVGTAEGMNVVMYGVQDRRAWLVDGASALLRLSLQL